MSENTQFFKLEGVVYVAMNRTTKKAYVGQTTLKGGMAARREWHYDSARKKEYDCPVFYQALLEYPPEHWDWMTCRWCYSRAELNAAEKEFIKVFRSRYPGGYNVQEGGE